MGESNNSIMISDQDQKKLNEIIYTNLKWSELPASAQKKVLKYKANCNRDLDLEKAGFKVDISYKGDNTEDGKGFDRIIISEDGNCLDPDKYIVLVINKTVAFNFSEHGEKVEISFLPGPVDYATQTSFKGHITMSDLPLKQGCGDTGLVAGGVGFLAGAFASSMFQDAQYLAAHKVGYEQGYQACAGKTPEFGPVHPLAD